MGDRQCSLQVQYAPQRLDRLFLPPQSEQQDRVQVPQFRRQWVAHQRLRAGLLAFGLAMLASPVLRAGGALPVSLGFLGTAAVVIATMVLWLGLRGAFDSFDVIRRFKP